MTKTTDTAEGLATRTTIASEWSLPSSPLSQPQRTGNNMTIHITSVEGPYTPITRIQEIERVVAQTCGVLPEIFSAASRKVQFARPRQILMYILYKHSELSLPDIGRRLKRDHTTIHHGWTKGVEALEKETPNLMAEQIREVEASLKQMGYIV